MLLIYDLSGSKYGSLHVSVCQESLGYHAVCRIRGVWLVQACGAEVPRCQGAEIR